MGVCQHTVPKTTESNNRTTIGGHQDSQLSMGPLHFVLLLAALPPPPDSMYAGPSRNQKILLRVFTLGIVDPFCVL